MESIKMALEPVKNAYGIEFKHGSFKITRPVVIVFYIEAVTSLGVHPHMIQIWFKGGRIDLDLKHSDLIVFISEGRD